MAPRLKKKDPVVGPYLQERGAPRCDALADEVLVAGRPRSVRRMLALTSRNSGDWCGRPPTRASAPRACLSWWGRIESIPRQTPTLENKKIRRRKKTWGDRGRGIFISRRRRRRYQRAAASALFNVDTLWLRRHPAEKINIWLPETVRRRVVMGQVLARLNGSWRRRTFSAQPNIFRVVDEE